MLKLIRNNLNRAQDRMRTQANSKRRDNVFKVGDYVFLKIQPYRQRSLAKRRFEKLAPRFFGPYRIKRTIGPVAYELELPPDAKVHPVFHVSMLKLAHGTFSVDNIVPLPITTDWEIDLKPQSVVSHRWVREAGRQVLELLISWCNRPLEESTWEPYDLVAEQFPDFRLEDKAFYREGSNDRNPIVYTRKQKKQAQLKAMSPAEVEEFNAIFGGQVDPLSQRSEEYMEWWRAVYNPFPGAVTNP